MPYRDTLRALLRNAPSALCPVLIHGPLVAHDYLKMTSEQKKAMITEGRAAAWTITNAVNDKSGIFTDPMKIAFEKIMLPILFEADDDGEKGIKKRYAMGFYGPEMTDPLEPESVLVPKGD